MNRNEPASPVHFPCCKQLHHMVILTSGMAFTTPGHPWSWNSLTHRSHSFSQAWESRARSAGLQCLLLSCWAKAGCTWGWLWRKVGQLTCSKRQTFPARASPLGNLTEMVPGPCVPSRSSSLASFVRSSNVCSLAAWFHCSCAWIIHLSDFWGTDEWQEHYSPCCSGPWAISPLAVTQTQKCLWVSPEGLWAWQLWEQDLCSAAASAMCLRPARGKTKQPCFQAEVMAGHGVFAYWVGFASHVAVPCPGQEKDDRWKNCPLGEQMDFTG